MLTVGGKATTQADVKACTVLLPGATLSASHILLLPMLQSCFSILDGDEPKD